MTLKFPENNCLVLHFPSRRMESGRKEASKINLTAGSENYKGKRGGRKGGKKEKEMGRKEGRDGRKKGKEGGGKKVAMRQRK